MKKYLVLCLLLPLSLSTIAQEHAGKAVKKKVPGLQTSQPATTEHGGQAVKQKKQAVGEAEHGGQAAKNKVPELLDEEHTTSTSEHGGAAVKKKSTEHAGEAVR